jgi:hypothetical protein
MRLLAAFVAFYGAVWSIYGWFTFRVARLLDEMNQPPISPDLVAEATRRHAEVLVMAGVFVASALVAVTSAFGLWMGRRWAKGLWLSWCGLLFAVFWLRLLGSPSSWATNLEMAFLGPFSWFAIRSYERRNQPAP